MDARSLLLQLLDEAFDHTAWHGPNLWQSLRGVTRAQASWRPAPGRHNIWEVALHAAYWKYVLRRRLEGGKRGGFVLPGSNFFKRPEPGKSGDAAWKRDKEILRSEHAALREAIGRALSQPRTGKLSRALWGVAFHDVYHAGQIRLLRRLMEKR